MDKIKLLMIGSGEKWSLENHYRKYLTASGKVDLEFFPVQSLFYRQYNKSVFHKILFRSGLSGLTRKLDKLARQKVLQTNPSIVWVFKGMELSPSFFTWVRSKGIKLVNYNPDNPFVFSGPGSGNSNVTKSVGLYDLHLSYDHTVKKQIEKEFGIPCKILPFGFELSDALYNESIRQEEIIKVCFVGNPDTQRAAFLEKIAAHLPVDIYGHNWKSFTKHSNITCFEPVYGDEFWRVLYRYRVQLNLMRLHNPVSHNMRSFEVPGAGGIGLFPYTEDHRMYFDEGKEIFLYRDADDCVATAQEIMRFSTDEAASIRKNARLRSLQSGYTYEARTQQVLKMFTGLFDNDK